MASTSGGSGVKAPTAFQWAGASRNGVRKFASATTPGHGVTDRRASTEVVEAGRAAATTAAAETSDAVSAARNGAPAFLNEKQQLFVDIVVEHANSIDACRQAEEMDVSTGSTAQD